MRIHQIDALRGLMAAVVVIQHIYLSFPTGSGAEWVNIIKYSPLRIFIAGHAAVLVFFVMSGFVVALPFTGGRSLVFKDFIVKRLARLYPPFAVAVLLAALLFWLVGNRGGATASAWLHENWNVDLSLPLVLLHLIGTGRADDISLNSPIWSLIVEIRVALIFPVLLLLATRWRIGSLIGGGLLLLGSSFLMPALGEGQQIYVSSTTILGNLVVTARYLIYFIIGIVMAETLAIWRGRLTELSGARRHVVVGLSVILLLAPSTHSYLSDWVIGVGAVGIVATTVAYGDRWRLLLSAPAQWLGRVSYSLYLIHMPLWLAAIHLGADRIGLPMTALLFLAIVFPAAEMMYRLVEQPSIALGRYLSGKRGAHAAMGAEPAASGKIKEPLALSGKG